MEAVSRERINDETLRKSVNALLKWRKKSLSLKAGPEIPHEEEAEEVVEEEEEESDDFMYLSITLKKPPHREITLAPHRIPLRHPLLLPQNHSDFNLCLIVDGKRITSESANKVLKFLGFPHMIQVLKISKLKSDYKSFESKRKLYDSFDAFFAMKNVVPLLPKVLGRVFYGKRRKVPVPLDLKADGSNWRDEIETACRSSLLCLSGGTCSAVRVGRWGVMGSEEIVENVYEAVDGVVKVVPKKWKGVRCLHLRFSNSVALPIYECRKDDGRMGGDAGGFGVAGTKRMKRRGRSD